MLCAALYPLIWSNTRAASKALHASGDTGIDNHLCLHCQVQANAVKLPLLHPVSVGVAQNWVVYLPYGSGTWHLLTLAPKRLPVQLAVCRSQSQKLL